MCVILLCHFSAKAQQLGSNLKEAFGNKSQEMLDVFINENNINKALPDKRIESKIRSALTALFQEYSNKQTTVQYADAVPHGEEYIIVQPKVEVCFTDKSDIDSALIRHRQRRTLEGVVNNPHKNTFSFFMSGNYSDFNRLTNCAVYRVGLDDSINDYKVIVADTAFVKEIAGFLSEEGEGRASYLKKVNFLNKKLKLYEQGGQVRMSPPRYTFHYSLFVDRIVFDEELQQVYIQYSFRNKSSEANFLLENKQWILKKNIDVLEY